ncbi:MAG TPA: hypothetical protein QGF35_04220 [Dehalococcoidia bacterium]|nr:hypothetical protein [Dehalococcoidia bacterium]
MEIFRTGLWVALILGVMTVAEYFAAASIEDGTVRFLVLAVGTVAEAALIAWYYMHFYRLWRVEEVH